MHPATGRAALVQAPGLPAWIASTNARPPPGLGRSKSPGTLDFDASQIVAEKEAAQFTYKGEQGYMPMPVLSLSKGSATWPRQE